jgi:hypothetical protein
MPWRDFRGGPKVLCFEAFGVRVGVRIGDPKIVRAVREILPPTSRKCAYEELADEFSIEPHGDSYEVLHGNVPLTHGADLEVALRVLDSHLRIAVGTKAPDHVFVHAGAVAIGDRAILLPGASFAGKTTLVTELITLGATYLSDECAVLDADGLVLPYAKPLSIRPRDTEQASDPRPRRTNASSLGAVTGSRALTVGVIAAARYRPGAEWRPTTRTPAQGALLLMSGALATHDDPRRVMVAVRRAAAGAIVLEGERGDAGAAAADLIARASGDLQPMGE